MLKDSDCKLIFKAYVEKYESLIVGASIYKD